MRPGPSGARRQCVGRLICGKDLVASKSLRQPVLDFRVAEDQAADRRLYVKP